MTGTGTGTPPTLLHNLEHNKVLHEQVVLLTVITADVPQVAPEERLRVEPLAEGFFRVIVAYGFTEAPDVPAALEELGSPRAARGSGDDDVLPGPGDAAGHPAGPAWPSGASGCSS